MEHRTLGRSGLQVSLMGMGSGGHDPLGQKSGRPEAEMHKLLQRAYELGINYFDTSPGYLDSELILGRALKDLPRDDLIVSTKIPLAAGDAGQVHVMSHDEVAASVESSLRRLQLDTIDIMLVAVATDDYLEPVMNDHIPVLQRLQREGKIRFLGSSEQSRSDGSHEWLRKSLPEGVFDVAMVAHNMINHSAQRTVFPVCKEQNVGVINIFTVRNVFSLPNRLREVVADLKQRGLVDAAEIPDDDPLGWLGGNGSVSSVVEAAYRFAAYTEPVSTVMNGTILVHELEENVANITKGPLPTAVLERLRSVFGRIDEPIGN